MKCEELCNERECHQVHKAHEAQIKALQDQIAAMTANRPVEKVCPPQIKFPTFDPDNTNSKGTCNI